MDLFINKKVINQPFKKYHEKSISIDVKREDLLHKQISGNKWRKLKYNFLEAIAQGRRHVITFGGAYSNHIAATAAAGNHCGIKTIGIIRGEELGESLSATLSTNATLRKAHDNGMDLYFVARKAYQEKENHPAIREIINSYTNAMLIPEGGTNALAVKGCTEILTEQDLINYDLICVAAGTGGTAAGIINSTLPRQKVRVYAALKGDFLRKNIQQFTNRSNFALIEDTRFGGYARGNDSLIEYMNLCFRKSEIPLDPIYTAKMMYGIEQDVLTGVIPEETRILAIHTGGLQGITPYNERLLKKEKKLISYGSSL